MSGISQTGLVLAVVASLCYGVWALLSGIAVRTIPPETGAALSYLVGAIVAVTYVFSRGFPLFPRAAGTIYAVLGGAIIGIGIVSYYLALNYTSSTTSTTILALFFVVTAVLEVAFLDASLGLRHIAGVGLAIGAILLLMS